MAGAHITLEIRSDDVGAALQRLLGFSDNGLDQALGEIGEYLQRSTRDRAEQQIDPSGTPWAALSPRYQKWKDKKRPGVPKLKFDFHMLGDQFSHQVLNHELFVGTNAKYGAIHQFGGTIKTAARSQFAYFRQDLRTGEVGNRFVKKSRSNFAQGVDLPAQEIKIPARPWLGLSTEDDGEVLAILGDHLKARLLGGSGAGA